METSKSKYFSELHFAKTLNQLAYYINKKKPIYRDIEEPFFYIIFQNYGRYLDELKMLDILNFVIYNKPEQIPFYCYILNKRFTIANIIAVEKYIRWLIAKESYELVAKIYKYKNIFEYVNVIPIEEFYYNNHAFLTNSKQTLINEAMRIFSISGLDAQNTYDSLKTEWDYLIQEKKIITS